MYTDFEYANRRLSDFGFILGHIDSSTGVHNVNIGCDITFHTVKNNHSSIHSKASSTYDNVYTATFEIIKKNCKYNRNEMYISDQEVRQITRWLNRHEHYKFKPINRGFDADIHHYGSFNVEVIFLGYRAIGLSLTFTSNAPYGFASPITTRHMLLNQEDKVSIYGDSDEYTTLLPKIEIKCFQDGDLILTNHTTERDIKIYKCKQGEVITLDGEHQIALTDNKEHDKTSFANDFNYEYFEILVDDMNTKNEYSSTLPCELTVTYLPIRKVGVY